MENGEGPGRKQSAPCCTADTAVRQAGSVQPCQTQALVSVGVAAAVTTKPVSGMALVCCYSWSGWRRGRASCYGSCSAQSTRWVPATKIARDWQARRLGTGIAAGGSFASALPATSCRPRPSCQGGSFPDPYYALRIQSTAGSYKLIEYPSEPRGLLWGRESPACGPATSAGHESGFKPRV